MDFLFKPNIFSVCLAILLMKELLAMRNGVKSNYNRYDGRLPKLGIDNVYVSLANAMADHMSIVDQIKSLRQIIELFFQECVEPKTFHMQL